MDDLTIYGGGRMGPSALEGLNSYRRSVGLAELSPAEYAEYQKGSPGVEFPADAVWDADALYAPPQAVLHRGSSWRALRPTLGDEPGAADDAWALLAQGGDVAMIDEAVAQATAAGAAQVALAEQQVTLAGQQADLSAQAAGQSEAARIAAAESAAHAQSAALTVATWAALSALTATVAGTGAEVLDSDTGTHTDPVVGGTVANGGRYTWSASPAGWRRIGDTGLAGKAPLASPALTGVPTVPTAAAGTDTTQIASTEFVGGAVDAVAAPVAPDGAMVPLMVTEDRAILWTDGTTLDGPGLSADLARSATRLAAPEADVADPAAVPVVRDDAGRVLAWASADGLQWPGMEAWLHARAAPRVSAALTPVGTDGRSLHRHGAKVSHLQSGIAPLPKLKVALVGDSWVGQALIGAALRDRYAAAGLPHSASGFVHPHSTDNHIDTAVAFGGTWTYANARAGDATPYGVCPTGRCAYTSAAGATMTYSGLVGTTLEIHCHQHGGAWTYSLDGAPAVAMTDASDATLRVVSLAAGAGPHTIVITATSGIVSMLGVYATSATGFELSLLGSSGTEARLTAGWIGAAQGQVNRIAPDLMVTILGTNDCISLNKDAAPGAHAVHLQTIIGAFRAAGPCGIVCVTPCRSNRADIWPLWAYRDAVLAMALADGAVEVLSALDLFGPFAELNTLGLWLDSAHLNTVGSARLAALFDTHILHLGG